MIGYPGGDLYNTSDKPLSGALDLFTLQIEFTEQVKQVVGQKPHLASGLVRIEFVATGLVPTQGILAFLDTILHVRPAVVGFHDLLGRQPGVGHDETHPREQLAQQSRISAT